MKSKRKCEERGCSKVHHGKGLCYVHHQKYIKRKSISGFLSVAYFSMKCRVKGTTPKYKRLYRNLSIISKEEFFAWSKSSTEFLRLFKTWSACGWPTRLSPSVNRIDSSKGYTLDNIEWITHSQNSGLSAVTKKLQHKKQIYKILGVK